MSRRFEAALAQTLKWEGGWSNHPHDPGGPTMRGVIQTVYDGYRDREGKKRQSVRLISERELQDIYRRDYWDAVRGDELPAGVDLAVFDFGVNSGPPRAARFLQAALGVAQDGHIGPATLAAVERADPLELVRAVMARRRRFVRRIKTYPTFGRGWERRMNGIERAACAMCFSRPVPEPKVLADADAQSAEQGRAVEERKPASGTVIGPVVAAGGAAAGGVVNEAARPIPPPPEALTDSVTNLGLWQSLGQGAASFGTFVADNPVTVVAIVAVVAAVWLLPRMLPVIWSRET